MRIGIDACLMTKGMTGIGMYIYEIIQWLAENDSEDEFFLYLNGEAGAPLALPDNWHVRADSEMNFLLWQIFELPKLVKEDCLELFWEPGNRMPVIPQNVKLILTVHDMASYLHPEYCSWQTHLVEKLFLRNSCRKADKIIAISEFTKKDIVHYFGIDDKKMRVIYNGGSKYCLNNQYDECIWNEICKKYELKNNYFLVIGTMNPRKNIEVIIDAYDYYRRTGGKSDLLFVGKKARNSEAIDKKLENCKYKDDVIITGYVDESEKEYLYRNTEALLFPSRYEGFGLPILEAMSVGSRVVTSNVSSIPEVAGEAALYLNEIDNSQQLASIMFHVESMSLQERAELVQKGLKQAELFSWSKCASEVLDVFSELK